MIHKEISAHCIVQYRLFLIIKISLYAIYLSFISHITELLFIQEKLGS
ncbi:hypothetical protein JOC58_004286 [Paenibacillus hunanensis]|uniref:Uncharacterized protein n=1 Tax=Paenibacillus hunanensis TaxID=539262 RepID=A0ABU1J4C5_9BACL|nr:hypothetical protein [Paenibacillus hunanensis]